jgi:hypothetical protein
MSPLRRVLAAVREGRARSLDDLAREAGVSPEETAAMLDYWVARGLLTREEIAPGCPAAGCGSCPVTASGCATRPRNAPALVTITPRVSRGAGSRGPR